MLTIQNLSKSYYSFKALDNVSLNIQRGEVVGIVGPNGAGKTTFFKLLAGFLKPDSGHINPTGAIWPSIGYKPERLLYPNNMRVADYLRLTASLSNLNGAVINQHITNSLAQMNLSEAANKKIKDCSKGMRQRVGLAQALMGNPTLLLLDEPADGLDPEGQGDIYQRLRELQALGKTIVMTSHRLKAVTQVCTRLVILHKGKIRYNERMSKALQLRPHTIIQTQQDLSPIRQLLESLHPNIRVGATTVTLEKEALALKRHILNTLLGTGFDVTHLEQKKTTIEEIYAEAVQ